MYEEDGGFPRNETSDHRMYCEEPGCFRLVYGMFCPEHKNRLPNARFWVYVNGDYVKVTLKPDQSLEHVNGGPTDEGWSSCSNTWEYEDHGVTHYWCSEGRDCDGRHSDYGESWCPIEHLGRVVSYEGQYDEEFWDGICLPLWGKVKSGQYDQFAEMAGY